MRILRIVPLGVSLRIIMISIIIMVFPTIALPAPLSRADKQAFFENFLPNCIKNVTGNPKTNWMTRQQIEVYCRCTGVRATDLIMTEDLRSGQMYRITAKCESAGNDCGKKLLKKWGH